MALSSLMDLAPETRLQIYGYLVDNCLAQRSTTVIRGLYLSCRRIHGEMEHDHIRHVRLALNAKRYWEVHGPSRRPFKISISPETSEQPAELIVGLPYQRSWPSITNIDDKAVPKSMILALRRLCGGPWRSLVLSFYAYNSSTYTYPDRQALAIFKELLNGLVGMKHNFHRISIDLGPEFTIDMSCFVNFSAEMNKNFFDMMWRGEAESPAAFHMRVVRLDREDKDYQYSVAVALDLEPAPAPSHTILTVWCGAERGMHAERGIQEGGDLSFLSRRALLRIRNRMW